jgi:hypothetical protein
MSQWDIEEHGLDNIKVFLRDIRVVSKKLKRELPKAYAERVMRQLKDRIYKQRFQFAALSTRYLTYKRKRGLSTRTFIATRAYVRNIRIRKVGEFWYVMLPNKKHPESKLTFVEIAQILEFGSIHNNIPPRPLWALQAANANADYPKFVKSFIRKFYSAKAGFNVGAGRGGHRILRIEA